MLARVPEFAKEPATTGLLPEPPSAMSHHIGMKTSQLSTSKISLVRKSTFALGAGALILGAADAFSSSLLIAAGVAGLFLAATDFGRQCPLLLSVRQFVSRLRRNS